MYSMFKDKLLIVPLTNLNTMTQVTEVNISKRK